ncbi:hypothetical protein E2C01_079332 [Portunus trituberculatus]|uniref:Uncharacterized protein n=1 Tax=Portunus trituberculatus TaxID=210409 RepID=A0A5B7IJA4_PORTR|nr:hypothetical protein [Portunus trituberculatus]
MFVEGGPSGASRRHVEKLRGNVGRVASPVARRGPISVECVSRINLSGPMAKEERLVARCEPRGADVSSEARCEAVTGGVTE